MTQTKTLNNDFQDIITGRRSMRFNDQSVKIRREEIK